MFYNDVDSFNELWREVARETVTKWVLNASMVSLSQWGMEKEDFVWIIFKASGAKGEYPYPKSFEILRHHGLLIRLISQ